MTNNQIFNVTVCSIGIAILIIHIITALLKKNRRRDENALINFFFLTVIHFASYLAFTFIHLYYTSDNFIVASYTCFYIFNNLEVFFLFIYIIHYVEAQEKTKKILMIANISLFSVFIILDIVNIFTGIFFTGTGGKYERADTMIISQIYQFAALLTVLFFTLFNKKLSLTEKLAFMSYCILPSVAIILQNLYKGYALAYVSIIIGTEILFSLLNIQKNTRIIAEQEKNKDAQVRIMMSQIQPHFIYNCLSSISTLISIDIDKAQKALDDFAEYLRHNLSSFTQNHLIPFEDELKHIETYLSLEKVRFNDRINIVYDIKVNEFNVPPLSIEPIVENAVKHGILKKIVGGEIIVKTYETDNAYIVEVIDNGVGFNMSDIDFNSNKHFGINNIKYRLKSMCKGDLEITSEINKGTVAKLTFFKE